MEVAALTAFLAPFLPYLLKDEPKVAGEVDEAFGVEAWRHAERLWRLLRPRIDEKPAAAEAAAEVAALPSDDRARGLLELQLESLLAADAALADEVERMWSEARAASIAIASEKWNTRVDRTIVTGSDVGLAGWPDVDPPPRSGPEQR
jgi:hypothetical protein